jgi:hypothetical protein
VIKLNKEVKVVNYVFKYKDKLNLLSIEQFVNYQTEINKIKLLILDKYIEKEVKDFNIENDKIVFDNLIITKNNIEVYIDEYHLNFNLDNSNLLNEFQKVNKGKNNYIMFDVYNYNGYINDEEVSDKIFVDFESITTILDDYYKIYSIDFKEFSGSFTMTSYDHKSPYINLVYKDTEFKNKKISNVRVAKFFKLSTFKLIVSSNYYWKVNLKVNKVYKSNPSLIPFKYHKGQLTLQMKKNLFKTNLDAISHEMLLISYKYM